MLIRQHDAETIVLMQDAIRASNNLIVHLIKRRGMVSEATWARLVEADYMLNSSVDQIIVEDDIFDERMAEEVNNGT